jgi:hypothetical protein
LIRISRTCGDKIRQGVRRGEERRECERERERERRDKDGGRKEEEAQSESISCAVTWIDNSGLSDTCQTVEQSAVHVS